MPRIWTATDRDKRDAAMVARRASGATLRAIGAEFELSKERVRSVLCKAERLQADAEKRKLMLETVDLRDIPIEVLELSVRLKNVLSSLAPPNDRTLGGVLDLTDTQLMRSPNCGKVSIREWREFLRHLGED